MSLGFGFSLPAYVGYAAGFGPSSFGSGATLALDFLNGNNTLDPRVTFTRTTNATVTGGNGLIQNAPMNLLTHSEQFDNSAWAKTALTVTANATVSPDGSATADKLIPTTAAATARFVNNDAAVAIGFEYTQSVYAKAAEYSILQITGSTGFGLVYQNFDLATGTLGGTSGGIATITPVGNGWFRCTYTLTASSTAAAGRMLIAIVPNVNSARLAGFTGDGASGLFLWGAQLEVGSTATTYNPTTVKNLLGFTENFDNAAWTKSNATITSGFTDIYGQPFAQQITATGANATVLSSYTAVASTPYTFSVYLQRVSGTGNVDISVDGTTWVTQTLTTTLQRFSVTGSPTAGAKTPGIRIVASGDVVVAFGAQLSDSASVDPYVYQPVAAPASTAYYGPRFDYDPVTLQPKGLLIEEQRTQLLLNSSLAGTSLATQNVTVTAVAHTLSFYGTGTVTLSGTSTAGPLVGTGAYPARSTLTFTPTAGTLTLTVTGTVQFAQLEIGAFATSFIPSAASQVTRAVDSASMIGNNFARWYSVNEGTFYAQSASFGDAAVRYITFASDGTNTNRILQYFSTSSIIGIVTAGGTSQATMGVSGTTAAKTALAYATDNFAFARNATLATDSAGTVPVGLTQMQIGAGLTAATSPLNGTIARIAYYNRRLANTELQGITS
jgi:hypothetical protein